MALGFTVAIGSEERYQRCAKAGLEAVARPGDVIIEKRDVSSLAVAYNQALESVCAAAPLEALVLMHDDTEIVSPQFRTRLGDALAEPDVAIVGTIGARGVSSLRWWDGEMAGAVEEPRGKLSFSTRPEDVDAVDGLLLAMSPWAVRNLRFDEALGAGFHGYDLDICFQARRRHKRVLAAELGVLHHTKGGFGDRKAWLHADRAWRSKWVTGERQRSRLQHSLSRARLRLREPRNQPFK